MDIDQLIDEGQLDRAIHALTEEIRAEPLNFRRRNYLFTLLCFAGEYTRAEQQLEVLATENQTTAMAAPLYRALVQATALRERIFREGMTPPFLLGSPSDAEPCGAVLRALAQEDHAQAAALLREREQLRVRRSAICGEPGHGALVDFRDADDRTAGFLELFVEGQYTWLPLETVSSFHISPPSQLRDLLWAPTRVVASGGAISGFMPVLYAGSIAATEGAVRLGQLTDWVPRSDGLAIGRGQRLFTDGENDIPVLGLGSVMFAALGGEAAESQVAAEQHGAG